MIDDFEIRRLAQKAGFNRVIESTHQYCDPLYISVPVIREIFQAREIESLREFARLIEIKLKESK